MQSKIAYMLHSHYEDFVNKKKLNCEQENLSWLMMVSIVGVI